MDDTSVYSIDSYYNAFEQRINDRTNSVVLENIKIRAQDRLWNRILSGIRKKILVLKWEQKIVFQSLWLKISQRKDIFKFTTSDIVIQRELINAINDFRKEQWLSELSYNIILSRAAYNHANDMYINFPYDTNNDGTKELIAHLGTDGTRVQDRVEILGYIPYFVWENIAYNQTTVSQVITDRKNSPTHYENLVSKNASQIGAAKIWSYWVMVIGKEKRNI